MRTIICNKVKPDNPEYFKRCWRIPYQELSDIGWVAIDQSEIKGKISDFFIQKYHTTPSAILFWNTNTFIQNNWKEIVGNKWTKCIYMDDLHQTNSKIKQFRNLVLEKFDYIFSTYGYTFLKFYPLADPKKIIWYPHNINHRFRVDFNSNTINKILLSGCIDKDTYPFRYHIFNLSKTYPIDVLQQLSYAKPNHQFYGHKYIQHLNKYLAAVACCSNKETPYIVNKFFEIPASGALLLAYDEFVKEPLEKLGFKDGENYLSANFENAVEKINFIVDPKNRKEVDRIRRNGYELVWKNHTLLNRIKLIDDSI